MHRSLRPTSAAVALLAALLLALGLPPHAPSTADATTADATGALVGPRAAVAESPARPRALEVGAQWHGSWAEETAQSRTAVLDRLAASGAQWVRLDIGWPTIQPKRGSYDLNWGVPFVDSLIRSARARGLKVLVTFWRTPGWANGGRGAVVPPSNPQDYADALAWAARRWQGQVAAWEVWNEPNLAAFWPGTDPVRYTALLRAAYRTTKAAVPSATIVFGGTLYVDTDWIRRAYDAGAGGSFDVMAVHPYQGRADAPPESTDRRDRTRMTHTEALVGLMRSKGDGAKPIWFTEFGWSSHVNTASLPVWFRGVTEQVQAAYLTRAVALVRARWPQVKVMFWYVSRNKVTGQVHTDNRGLMRRDFSPKPVLAAFAAAAAPGSCSVLTAPVLHRVNPTVGAALLTRSPVEAAQAARRYGYTIDAGTPFRAAAALAPGLVRVHRLWNASRRDFLWLPEGPQMTAAIARYGYVDSGVDFAARRTPAPCTVPVFRLYRAGHYRLTATPAVRAALLRAGWYGEQIAFYAAPSPTG